MNFIALRWKSVLAGCLFLGALGAGVPFAVRWAMSASTQANEYPDAPFHRVDKDFPRIIQLRKFPPSGFEALRARRFLQTTGAISKATAAERDLWQQIFDGKYVKAREQAEGILAEQPQSIPALLVMAQVHAKSENNLPQALFHVRQARKLLEQRGLADPDDADSREWYLRALEIEYEVLRDLDQPENQLRVVELIEQVYEPVPWLKVWALMKCKRLDEAEAALAQTEKLGLWRVFTINSRCALEEQRGRRVPHYEAFKKAVKQVPYSAVYWANFGAAALSAFQHDEAERAYLKSASLSLDYHGTPYRSLGLLYLQQGKFAAALDAMRKAQKQRAQRPPDTLQSDQAQMDRSIALLLLAAGMSDKAERFSRRALLNPDRNGFTTEDRTDEALTNGVIDWTVLCGLQEQLAEQAAARSSLKELAASPERQALEFKIWTRRQELLKILQDPQRLQTFRPYMPGQCDMEAWLLGGLVQILPSGVAEEALRSMRAAEDHPAAAAYFDALEAELALAKGRYEDAERLARQALDGLPVQNEKLLRARTAVVAGEAARQLGRTSDAVPLFDQALRDFPMAFRLVHAAIPVCIEHDGSAEAQSVALALRNSPRFRADPAGLRLTVRCTGGTLIVELLGADQTAHRVDVTMPVDGSEFVAAVIDKFLGRLMSPALDLSQMDVHSLDASATSIRLRDDIDKILGPQ